METLKSVWDMSIFNPCNEDKEENKKIMWKESNLRDIPIFTWRK